MTDQTSAPASGRAASALDAEPGQSIPRTDPGSALIIRDRRSAAALPRPLPPGATPALNAALADLQAELPTVGKSETADVKNDKGQLLYSYDYADLADVSAAVLPLLGKHGLAFSAWPTIRGERFVLYYVLLHESGEQRDGAYPLPDRSTPQQLGSHITYGRRYCLSAVTGVAPGGQDDDGKAAEGVPISTSSRPRPNGEQQQMTLPPEIEAGRAAVRREWARVQVGKSPVEHYGTWPERKAQTLLAADEAELRRYAAFLATLPDYGSNVPPKTDQVDETGKGKSKRPQDPAAPGTLSTEMRVKLQALLSPIYGKDRAKRIGFLQGWAERPAGAPEIASTNDLSWDEARKLIDELEQNERKTPADQPPADDTQSEA